MSFIFASGCGAGSGLTPYLRDDEKVNHTYEVVGGLLEGLTKLKEICIHSIG